jgi:Uma2 family endonuclease
MAGLRSSTKKYTYADYIKWSENEPVELIDGVPHAMVPTPSRAHQKLLVELSRQFANYLKEKSCEVYMAPFEVRLPEKDEADADIKNVVQPDLAVICDQNKLDDKGCKGSPDLIIEVMSPASVTIDYIKKLHLYEKNSVKEYWIIHPIDKIIMVYELIGKGSYGRPRVYNIDDKVKVGIFEDLIIDLAGILD